MFTDGSPENFGIFTLDPGSERGEIRSKEVLRIHRIIRNKNVAVAANSFREGSRMTFSSSRCLGAKYPSPISP